MIKLINQAIAFASSRVFESITLLFVRISLAGIFWRSARTKVEDGSLLTINENTIYQFGDEPFNNVPVLNGELGAYVTMYAEHLFPILLVVGLASRLSAAALLGMTLVIQIFVFPEAWWSVHMIWVALALVIITRGPGMFSLDQFLAGKLNKTPA